MLIRLVVLGGLIIALTGLGGPAEGDSGGELAMALADLSLRQNVVVLKKSCSGCGCGWGKDKLSKLARRQKVYKATIMSQRQSELVPTDAKAKVSGIPFLQDPWRNCMVSQPTRRLYRYRLGDSPRAFYCCLQ